MRVFTAIDLFAGCGGASLGLRWTGFRVKAAVEIDKMCCSSYAENHPKANMLQNDIQLLSGTDILKAAKLKVGKCTVVMGCPPCQGFSRHRLKGSGLGDPRNDLVGVFGELVGEMQPMFFIFENVPGLTKSHNLIWQSTKNKLKKAGYRIISEGIIDAVDYGVPQHRKRFTAIGCRIPGAAIGIPDAELGPWHTVRDAIGDLRPLENGEIDEEDPMHCAPTHSEKLIERFKQIEHDGGSRSGLPPDMQLECHKKHDGHNDVFGRLSWDKPSNTLTGGCTNPSKGRFLHPEQNRGLTLREAARLQGFPDSYKFHGSRTQIAMQIGNSVPPQLMHAIGLRLRQNLPLKSQSVS